MTLGSTRRASTTENSSSWKRNWAADLCRLILLTGLALAAACSQTSDQAGKGKQLESGATYTDDAPRGWMTEYASRSKEIAKLLSAQPGWTALRDGDLLEAARSFSGSDSYADRVGFARAALGLAELFDRLGDLTALAQDEYRASGGVESTDLAQNAISKEEFAAAAARFAISTAEGLEATEYLLAKANWRNKALDRYRSFKHLFALAALAELEDLTAQEVAHLRIDASSLAGFVPSQADCRAGPVDEYGATEYPALLFGPVYDGEEALEVCRVRQSTAFPNANATYGSADGLGALSKTIAALAQLELAKAGPFEDPLAEAERTLEKVERTPRNFKLDESAELLVGVYRARRTAVSRWAADAALADGQKRKSLAMLERAQVKAHGFETSFFNPPAYLVELAAGYARVGEYASSTAVLYNLTRQFAPVRGCYESVKRLYASRSGGEARPL